MALQHWVDLRCQVLSDHLVSCIRVQISSFFATGFELNLLGIDDVPGEGKEEIPSMGDD